MAEHNWLVMCLEGPLLAFGGVQIDHVGVTRDFPATSMLTGLLANALGYRRTDWQKHQYLQDRLIFATRRDRENSQGILLDMQNAELEKNDQGWTTRGIAEGREGNSYNGPHRRQRYYHMDNKVTIVLRLKPIIGGKDFAEPSLEDLSNALDYPQRPLFIGRKPCLTTNYINRGLVQAANAFNALELANLSKDGDKPTKLRALWPYGEGPSSGSDVDKIIDLADLRNWKTGLHGGTRRVVEGRLSIMEEQQQ